ncbi:MAG TPA: pitrilysin family protein, partial [Geminicoccaceae bacterium]|nr:pitrilysin family protein [Geminicoccaceae bacterium]
MANRRRLAGAVLVAGLMTGLATTLAQPTAAATRIEEVTSPGGIRAYLIRESSIPFLSMSFQFKGGSTLDPAGKEGLAYMASGLLDEGAGGLDSQAFRTELEDLAIRLGFDAGRDDFSGDLRTLNENRGRAFELLRLALTEPRFDQEPVERVRSQILTALARRSEDPNTLASETWFEAAFPDHPYGRPVRGTPETVAGIAVDDLRGFVERRLARDNLIVGVAGDITAEELGPLLDLAFGDLRAASIAPDVVPTEPVGDGRTVVVRRPIPQSVVTFGHGGIARQDPDFYPAYVANHILGGGGFGSRLTEEVREKRGLAYSVYSYLYTNDYAPLWLGGVGTNNQQAAQSLELIRREIERMRAGEVTEEELNDAKTYLTGSFPLRLTSNDQIAQLLAGIQRENLGLDYLERRNE